MKGVNKVIILGNLGADPDIRYMSSGKIVANISIATVDFWNDKNSGKKVEKVEWHRAILFNRLAEITKEYLKKGSKVYIEGKLQTRTWKNANNENRYITEILVFELQILNKISSNENDEKNNSEKKDNFINNDINKDNFINNDIY